MAGGDEAEAEDSEVVGELGVRAIKENIFLEKGFGVEWGEECREFLDGNCVNDPFSFTCAMKACGSLAYMKLALQLHGLVEKFDFGSNVYMAIQNSIMDMYIKSGKSLSTFVKMWSQGVRPNSMTYASVLSACTSIYDLEWGTHLHAQIVRMEPTIDVLLGSGLVDMYASLVLREWHAPWLSMILSQSQEAATLSHKATMLLSPQ
nr:putative pentatricopeptide repeat-containing protein [Quercus suber]